MIPFLCLAILAGAERVDVHLVEAEDLRPQQRAELETLLAAAITARAGRQVVIRSPASTGDVGADRVLVRAFLGPHHLRLVASRLRPGLPPIAAEQDLPPVAFPDHALDPLVFSLFPAPELIEPLHLAAPSGRSDAPLWIMGASVGVGVAAAAVAVASTLPIPALQERGLIDGGTWSASGSGLDARPIAMGLAIAAGLGCVVAIAVAALDDAE